MYPVGYRWPTYTMKGVANGVIRSAAQVGILGMHAIQERPVARNGEIVIRPMMYLALSYDHRVVDGATAVQFLVKVKQMIEDPETLLIEG